MAKVIPGFIFAQLILQKERNDWFWAAPQNMKNPCLIITPVKSLLSSNWSSLDPQVP